MTRSFLSFILLLRCITLTDFFSFVEPFSYSRNKSHLVRASLVVQWLRIRLPMQGTQVRALVREDPTCRGATKPVCYSYWACALEPVSHNFWACVPQLQKPTHLGPVIRNKRSHCNEKPARSNEDPTQPKINKFKKQKIPLGHGT